MITPVARWTAYIARFGIALLGAAAWAEGPCAAPAYTDAELQMLAFMNQERADAGEASLVLHPELTHVARRFARYLKENASGYPTYLGHESLDGTTIGERIRSWRYRASLWGENLAARDEPITPASVAAMYEQWATSGEHWENIVHPSFEDVGIGFYDGPGDTNALGMYGVVDFGVRAYGDYGVGEVEILSPGDGVLLPFGEEAAAAWTRSEWVTTVWVRVSFNGGMEWIHLSESTAASSAPIQMPSSPTSDMMVWVGSTDPVDSFWYFDCTRCIDVVERPRWVEIARAASSGLPRLVWTSVPGRRYRVEGRPMPADAWQTLAEALADGPQTSWDDPGPPTATRVYRVSVLGL